MGASSSVYVLWWAPEAWLVGSATGLGLPCGPSSLVEGLGRGPFPGRRYPGGHFSLSPAGEESKRVVGTAVGVGALRPKIGPCLHGAQHRPSLTAAFPPRTLPTCALFLQAQVLPALRLSATLSLSSARALGSFQNVERA